jgi:nucleotide-binding universal stress UspA family protein
MSLKSPILVAADLSPSSEDALRQDTTLAAAFGTTLAVCHVLPGLSQVRVLFPRLAGENEAADAVRRGAPCSVLAVPLRTVSSPTTVA